MSTSSTPQTAPNESNQILQLYGDLIFDLCESVLWSRAAAKVAVRATLKQLKNRRSPFVEHERAWVIQVACQKILDLSHRHGRRLTSSEQIQLDATPQSGNRIQQFDAYFHRLTTEDQILMLLRDKYGFPYPEIAASLGLPEATIKLRRAQSLRALEEWLWEPRA